MNRCLVTKLNGSVDNTSLLRIGEMRIGISKIDSPNHWTQSFRITVNKLTVLEIIGDGYFTDVNLTANKGKKITLNPNVNEKVYVSNGNFEVAILDKYALVSLFDYDEYSEGNSTYSQKNKSISDIGAFKYSTAMTSLGISNANISGDIANLKNLTALTRIELIGANISGDIANLKNLTAMTILKLSNTHVSGDIANLKNLTALTNMQLSNTQIPLTGEISALSTLSKCETISLPYCKLTGDLAILPDACCEVYLYYNKGSVFTWSTRPSSAYIISFGDASLYSNVDKMLQDQAQCQVGPTANKTISATGTRTSASDDAVATLQQKGYTVIINPA